LLAGGDAGKRRAGLAEEVGLEGHHAGTGEQQGRIAERDQGGARQHLVVPLFEEVEKTFADVRARHIWPARSVIVLSSNPTDPAIALITPGPHETPRIFRVQEGPSDKPRQPMRPILVWVAIVACLSGFGLVPFFAFVPD